LKSKYKILFCEIYDDGTVGGSHSIMYNIVTNLANESILPIVGFLTDNLYTDKYKNDGISVINLPNPDPSIYVIPFIRKIINWYKLIFKSFD